MNIVNNFLRMFHDRKPKAKAFIIDDTVDGIESLTETLAPLNMETDGFTDARKLLFSLHLPKNVGKYRLGIIHENGSKYKPQILCQFIRQIDPNIKLIICKDTRHLLQSNELLVLT